MANNTDTYWEADGQSLHTFARSIETMGGMSPPPLRGENIVVPLSPGARHLQKVIDQNTITLAMWVRGVPQDAGQGASRPTKAQFQSNWNDLLRLLWRTDRQVKLTKRFYDRGSVNPIAASALVEYAGQLAPTMIGRNAAKCAVDLRIAEGLFYADTPLNTPLVNGDNTIVVPGNAPTLNFFIRINGARTNTRILNKTNGMQFTYPQAILANEYLHVTPRDYGAQHKPASSPEYDASTRIIWDGGYQWLQLEPGENIINVLSTSGAGVITLEARGAWV